ncbi:hypothetical protein [Methylotenera sp.]|uniref:hypothetical protein n=1 Tax=Methylotenera sp. TaxID=2051956 RepID=UPI00273650B6|nr:hypothetical protein [Methylotenera sp.]MDP3211483.1 hypothetical protein [Methylotenera sp.]
MSTDTDSSAEAVQSNQFLIVNDGHGESIYQLGRESGVWCRFNDTRALQGTLIKLL